MRQQVENVEAELALLRAQCSQRRNYVENSIEGSSPAASPGASRRKRIILMVSRTVTTIIQVSFKPFVRSIDSLISEHRFKTADFFCTSFYRVHNECLSVSFGNLLKSYTPDIHG